MKVLSIGDIHGNTDWKCPLLGYDPTSNTGCKTTINDFDKVVFIGDYVDSFHVNNHIMKQNLEEIIELKKKHSNKVVLLLGNHDLQYLFSVEKHECSGYRPGMRYVFEKLFRDNLYLFQVSYQYKNYIWTHAGIHRGWYRFRFKPFVDKFWGDDQHKLTLSEQLNEAFEMNEEFLYDVGLSRGGSHDVGGPFWADRSEVYRKPIENYHQIVGHSRVEKIMNFEYKNSSITFIDVLESKPCIFYTLNIED